MFNEFLINPQTRVNLERYLTNPSQALLLVGTSGAGKFTLAQHVAAGLLSLPFEKLSSYAHFSVVEVPAGKQEIPIEAIRQITQAVKLQVPGEAPVRRVILVKDAHLMNQEAQNAFLKSIEEPAPGTVFILTANSRSGLLATIVSRTALVGVGPASLEATQKHFTSKSKSEVATAWALSQGAPGLLCALLQNEAVELRKAVDQAKALLAQSPYERLLTLDSIKDKPELGLLLDGLARVLQALYRIAARRGDKQLTQKLTNAVRLVLQARSDLEASVLPRLVALDLALALHV